MNIKQDFLENIKNNIENALSILNQKTNFFIKLKKVKNFESL